MNRPAAPAGAAALLLCALALPARGAEPEQPLFAFNGFGTLGLVHSSQAAADYTFDNLQPAGAGRNHAWSGDVDSRLGGQLTANLNPRLSAVLQLVSEYSPDNSYRPFVNWANVQYKFSPALSVRVGRIALASFLASDSRKVGYSNVFARPPIEVYRLLALNNSDGVDATYRFQVGDVTNSTTLLYGRRTITNTRGVDVHSTGVKGVFDTLDIGALTLHAAYQERSVDNQNPPLGKFMSLGAGYDPGNWFVSGEWVRVRNYSASGVKAVRAAWYLHGGARFGAFTPYVTLSGLRPLSDTGLTPVAQRTVATGVRWDVMRKLDLKLQYDHLRPAGDSYGTLMNVAPDAPKGVPAHVISLVADFIF
ncbi:hypothetical protein [Janthinobacterium sp.]|uniref:hypothetical protein n=1 Tax=Janthinobacterium sp. TaxID=1871054 RepID=UPI00293D248A|nr:hypothetical protein [Janthinobacterium sp.]